MVTRSARPQAGIQTTSVESAQQKVGDLKAPSFLLAGSQNGAQGGGWRWGPAEPGEERQKSRNWQRAAVYQAPR